MCSAGRHTVNEFVTENEKYAKENNKKILLTAGLIVRIDFSYAGYLLCTERLYNTGVTYSYLLIVWSIFLPVSSTGKIFA